MRVLTFTALFLAAAGLASADRITFKNGTVLEGGFLGATARQVRFDVNGDVQTYEIDQVISISFSGGYVQPAPPPPPPNPDRANSDRNNFPPPSEQPAPSRQYAQAPSPQNAGPQGITIPADTAVTIRMIDAVNSETTRIGQTFRASIDEPIMVADRAVVPRGADVITKLVDDQKSGKIQGRTVLTLALVSISVNGQMVDVTSSDVRTASSSRTGKSAGLIGGGAAVGAIVGALAGGGKGAAIGAASGGALGGATTVLTNGQQVKIPSETRLTFRLQYPVQI